MENKTYKIVKLVLLSLITFALLGILLFFLTNHNNPYFKWNFQKEKITLLDEVYSASVLEQLHVSLKTTDITVKPSEDNQVRIVVYGAKGEKANVKVENNQLYITKDEKNQFCFGFCFVMANEVVIYLPENMKTMLNVKTNSGDIWIDHFKNIAMNFETSSGDIQVGSLLEINGQSQSGDIEVTRAENVFLKTSSGDIDLENINGDINLETSSGDIEIHHFHILQNSNIKTNSGEVEISNITDCYVDAESTSGDINIKRNNRFSELELKIVTSSGDIEVK